MVEQFGLSGKPTNIGKEKTPQLKSLPVPYQKQKIVIKIRCQKLELPCTFTIGQENGSPQKGTGTVLSFFA